ncbi:MAG: HAMP domain-containing histidine kinase [Candidatus Pacearchaeota archaeon]|nr:HAMP domain-containing histidine kinase [Candidatus Pacearchaeota archaeon]
MKLDIKSISQRLLERIWYARDESLENSKPNLPAIALIAIFGFPLYYIVWQYLYPQPYENLWLRLVGAVLFIPLLFHDRWPLQLKKYLSTYWSFTIIYACPFFFTYMLLKNDASMVWGMSMMACIALMIVVIYDWLANTLAFVIGALLAYGVFMFEYNFSQPTPPDLFPQIPVYLFLLIAGTVFNYKRNLIAREKQAAMVAIGGNIAHELRTPIAGIRAFHSSINAVLPKLMADHQRAQEQGVVESFNPVFYGKLTQTLETIDTMTSNSLIIIDMLLHNSSSGDIKPDDFSIYNMADCIQIALDQYPDKTPDEIKIVSWDSSCNFDFYGSDVLMLHVLLNLLRNAIYHIRQAQKGAIRIYASVSEQGHHLHFRDTGPGIDPKVLPHVFKRFYSSMQTGRGSGIGLAFCKKVMESFGGTISVDSIQNQYTEFVLFFPRIPDHG